MGRTVFVGNLPSSTTQKELQAIFSICGQIEFASIHSFVDSNKEQMSYGFVSFKHDASAMKVIQELVKAIIFKACKFNLKPYKNHVIEVVNDSDREYVVIVKNVPNHVTDVMLKNNFNIVGAVPKVYKNRDNSAYVHFENDPSRRKALKEDVTLPNSNTPLVIELKEPEKRLDTSKTLEEMLYPVTVYNMPYESSPDDLRQLFSLCGPIISTSTEYGPRESLSGTVNFATAKAQEEAMSFHGNTPHDWDGEMLLKRLQSELNSRAKNRAENGIDDSAPVESVPPSDSNVARIPFRHGRCLIQLQPGAKPMSSAFDPITLPGINELTSEKFSNLQLLGEGGYGTVFKANAQKFGVVAYKQFNFQVTNREEQEVLNMIKHSSHPNIVRLLGIVVNSEKDRSLIGFFMEYCGDKTVHHAVRDYSNPIDPLLCYSWIHQAALGLNYLHTERQILHRDIKPLNMLLDTSQKLLKVCDLGISKKQDECLSGGLRSTSTYSSPEYLGATKGYQAYSYPTDVYSLGISIWEILTRNKPYEKIRKEEGVNLFELCIMIMNNGLRPDATDIDELEIRSLVERCWAHNPDDRPSMGEIAEFFENKLNIISNKD